MWQQKQLNYFVISRSRNHIQEHRCNNSSSILTRKKNHSETFTILPIKNYGTIVIDSNKPKKVIRYSDKTFIRGCGNVILG